MRWIRHSHSYSEGELSKSATGRASSRGQEGHRFEYKIGRVPSSCISVSSTGGSGGYHSASSRGTSQVKLFLSPPTFCLAHNHISHKREAEDLVSQGSLVILERATLGW